jgi:hypothetical protein
MQNAVFLAKTVKPLNIPFMAKPCQLPFCVVAHIELGLLDGAVEVAESLEILDDAAVTVCAERV